MLVLLQLLKLLHLQAIISMKFIRFFTGDYSNKNDVDTLSNIKWGTNGKYDGHTIAVGASVDKAVLDDITNNATGSDAESWLLSQSMPI